MIVVTYLLRQSITLYKNLGGLEPLSPIASAATAMHSTREVYASSMAPVYWVQIAQLALAAARPRRGFDRLPLKDSFTQSKHCALPRFVSPGK